MPDCVIGMAVEGVRVVFNRGDCVYVVGSGGSFVGDLGVYGKEIGGQVRIDNDSRLRCFLFFMAILFLAELVAVIVIGATGDDIAKRIIDDGGHSA